MRVQPRGRQLLSTALWTLRDALLPESRGSVHEALTAIARDVDTVARDGAAGTETFALLDAASVRLRRDLLGALPPERRYAARLVARALAVAARQLANGDIPDVRERERLRALVGSPSAGTGGDVACDVASGSARLAARIRRGDADPGHAAHDATLAHLESSTLEALAESNPAYQRARASIAPATVVESSPHGAASSLFAARVRTSFAAWMDVAPAFWNAATAFASIGPPVRTAESWFALGGAFGRAVSASARAGFEAQADVMGFCARKAAANPNVPMVAVEAAHQLHDLSLSFAESSAAFFDATLAPFARSRSGARS